MTKFFGDDKHVQSHNFRPSWATHYYDATKDIATVQKVLGHKDIKTTMSYLKTTQNETRQKVEDYYMQQQPSKRQRTGAQAAGQ